MRLPSYVQDTLAHAREDRLRAVALVATLLLPWMLIFARVGIEVCSAVIGLCFLWHSYRTRQWQWLEEPFTRLCLVAWGWLALVVTPLALTPATSATDALLWFRLPLLVLALRHFVLRTKAARTVLGMMLLALLMLVMLYTLWQYLADTSLTGHARLASGRLTGPFTSPKVGLFLGYMLLPAVSAGVGVRAHPAAPVDGDGSGGCTGGFVYILVDQPGNGRQCSPYRRPGHSYVVQLLIRAQG